MIISKNFILCFSVSQGAIEHLLSFLNFTVQSVSQRELVEEFER